MKILLIDDDIFYLKELKKNYSGNEIDHLIDPREIENEIKSKKININEYDFIFCDRHFDDIFKDCFELNMSSRIRKLGYKNDLILYSNSAIFDFEYLSSQESFDYILDKSMDDVILLEELKYLCSESKLNSKRKYIDV